MGRHLVADDDNSKAPPAWANEVLFAIQKVDTKVGALEEAVRVQNGRVFALEDARKRETKRSSDADLGHDAAIATILTEMAAMKSQVGSIHKVITGTLTNPRVLWVGRMLVLLLAAEAARRGIKVLP